MALGHAAGVARSTDAVLKHIASKITGVEADSEQP
jgi:hypothetical protein